VAPPPSQGDSVLEVSRCPEHRKPLARYGGSSPTTAASRWTPTASSGLAGHDAGAVSWACLASLIETCKLNGVDPQAYLVDVLTKLVNLWPAARLDDLLPWEWRVRGMTGQIEGVLGALIKRYNAISTEIDRSVNRLEVDGTVTYRPLFLAGNEKPTHNSVRTWVRRLDPAHGPGVAQTRASRVSSTPIPMRVARSPNQDKGENDPCPCGSGRKYKRCCAALDLSTLINRGIQRNHPVNTVNTGVRRYGGALRRVGATSARRVRRRLRPDNRRRRHGD
jgi:hypothetical protein